MKKLDYLALALILLVGIGSILVFTLGREPGSRALIVTREGEWEVSLSQNLTIRMETGEGYNLVEIMDGGIRVLEADCRDQLCVHQKAISRNHESIICLPNQVVAEVESAESSEYDAVAQ